MHALSSGQTHTRFRLQPTRQPFILGCIALTLLGSTPSLFSADSEFVKHIEPFLERYCLECHDAENQKGHVRLDDLIRPMQSNSDADRWMEIRDVVTLHEMPPEDYRKRPNDRAVEKFQTSLSEEFDRLEADMRHTGGQVVLRRLNRHEYANTIRSLFHFDESYDIASLLPEEVEAEGFITIGHALDMSPFRLDRSGEAASKILESALIFGPRPKSHHVHLEPEGIDGKRTTPEAKGLVARHQDKHRNARTDKGHWIGSRAGMWLSTRSNIVPVNRTGLYRISVHIDQVTRSQYDRNPILQVSSNINSPQYEVLLERQFDPDHFEPTTVTVETTLAPGHKNNFDFKEIMERDKSERVGKKETLSGTPEGALHIDWIEIEGPLYEQWPPETHRAVFGDKPVPEHPRAAQAILERFAERAFRRPPPRDEIHRLTQLYATILEGSKDVATAWRFTLQGLLNSPHFLYLVESPRDGEGPRMLDNYELASRLSYFLWSTMPDEELFELARKGELTDSTVLENQVTRMLADPRAQALPEQFAPKWLNSEELGTMPPDRKLYPDYSEDLESDLKQEVIEFFAEVLRSNEDVLTLIDSDFLVINQRLADYYDVDGVTGMEFRRVSLPSDHPRGGVITQGAVLTLPNDGIRTSPIKRAVWLLETILDDTPPAPPQGVPPVEEFTKGNPTTLRERLELHRDNPGCRSCHLKIDPLGFALEHFDAMGSWRDQEAQSGKPIDALGALPGGIRFNGAEDLKHYLIREENKFLGCLSKKLLIYGIGRHFEWSDQGALDDIVSNTKRRGRSMHDLITEIVLSDTFRSK